MTRDARLRGDDAGPGTVVSFLEMCSLPRAFLALILVTVAVNASGCAGRRARVSLPVLPETAAPRELTADQQIKQALARLTFGPLSRW